MIEEDDLLAEEDNLNAENLKKDTADTAEAEENKAAAGLGKFSSVKALLDAYNNLEAEFTRRSQRLKELEEGNKAEIPSSPGAAVNGEELLKVALSDENVKQAIVAEYLKTLATNKAVPLIIGGTGSAAPAYAPKTVREAGALAQKFLKN